MNGGWVCLHRQLLEHPLVTQLPATWFRVFVVILMKANWKSGTWWNGSADITIERGSLIISTEKLGKISGASRKQIRGCLDYLSAANMAAIETTNRYTTITIRNYDAYQSTENTEGQDKGQPEGTVGANGWPSQTVSGATIEQSKQYIRNKHMSKSHDLDVLQAPPATSKPKRKAATKIDPDVQAWFDAEFWPIYPRRESRQQALVAANAKATDQAKRDLFIARLRGQLPVYLQRKQTSGQSTIPLGSTWFNQNRFEDELQVIPVNGKNTVHANSNDDYPEYKPHMDAEAF